MPDAGGRRGSERSDRRGEVVWQRQPAAAARLITAMIRVHASYDCGDKLVAIALRYNFRVSARFSNYEGVSLRMTVRDVAQQACVRSEAYQRALRWHPRHSRRVQEPALVIQPISDKRYIAVRQGGMVTLVFDARI